MSIMARRTADVPSGRNAADTGGSTLRAIFLFLQRAQRPTSLKRITHLSRPRSARLAGAFLFPGAVLKPPLTMTDSLR